MDIEKEIQHITTNGHDRLCGAEGGISMHTHYVGWAVRSGTGYGAVICPDCLKKYYEMPGYKDE